MIDKSNKWKQVEVKEITKKTWGGGINSWGSIEAKERP